VKVRVQAMVGLAVAASVALVACDSPKSDKPTSAPSPTSASRHPTPPPSSAPPSTTPPSTPSQGQSVPKTKAGAIQRYEVYLHALGREDLDTVCDVAGPGAKKAEDEGLGPCTSTFPVVFRMISPAQKKALQTATVDPQRTVMETPSKVEIPAGAIKASVTFSEHELGDSTLEYLKNNWYITG
jgi:hypothetical protein